MIFNILVTGGLYSTQAGYSALAFCRASILAGHSIKQVFFYQDGVTQATTLSVPSGDEFDATAEWVALSQSNDVELVACISAAERRGVLSKQQAQEFGKDAVNLHASFSVAGLGVLHEAALNSDRMVTFK